MLTEKQRGLLDYLAKMQQAGKSPSYDEMATAIGQASKSGVQRLVNGLEERGFIRRLPHHARSIEVLRLTDAKVCPHCGRA